MRVSDFVKALFDVMTRHGDLDVRGEFEVKDKELVLKGVGLPDDDSEILIQLLASDKKS